MAGGVINVNGDYQEIKDVVEVVRCKDCESYTAGYVRSYLGWCKEWETVVRETGYCHNSERKKDA